MRKNSLAVSIVNTLIRVYQRTLSPDSGWFSVFFPHGCCKFYPSCSEYTRRAVIRHGVCMGIGYGAWRIIRCNPFSHGGYDNIS